MTKVYAYFIVITDPDRKPVSDEPFYFGTLEEAKHQANLEARAIAEDAENIAFIRFNGDRIWRIEHQRIIFPLSMVEIVESELGPGEGIVQGEVHYSAAWL